MNKIIIFSLLLLNQGCSTLLATQLASPSNTSPQPYIDPYAGVTQGDNLPPIPPPGDGLSFEELDDNHDNHIDLDEFLAGNRNLLFNNTEYDKKIFSQYDRNYDLRLDRNEHMIWFQSILSQY